MAENSRPLGTMATDEVLPSRQDVPPAAGLDPQLPCESGHEGPIRKRRPFLRCSGRMAEKAGGLAGEGGEEFGPALRQAAIAQLKQQLDEAVAMHDVITDLERVREKMALWSDESLSSSDEEESDHSTRDARAFDRLDQQADAILADVRSTHTEGRCDLEGLAPPPPVTYKTTPTGRRNIVATVKVIGPGPNAPFKRPRRK